MSSKGKPLLYVKIQKVLYGLLSSALLFYIKLLKCLDTYVFYINPQYVANQMINNKQMTVVWHLDDLKVSHVDRFETNKFEDIYQESMENL